MATAPHILVVDDDREIRDLVARYLRKHELRVDTAEDGRAMFRMIGAGRYDLVVLDLMLPGEDGLALCRRLRAASTLPVIMLTAMGEEADRIVGLEMGADDYLSKPFSPRELLARIRAVLRRAASPPPATDAAEAVPSFAFAGWRLDPSRRELRAPDGALVSLTGGEYELLLAFVERPRRVLTRDQLLDLTRGRDSIPFDRAIDVQLSRLRRKVEPDPKVPTLIKTVRGGGYVLAADVRKS